MADATNKVYYCPVEVVLDLLGSKWKPSVVRSLGRGVDTVGELRKELPLITRRTLDALLSELERNDLIGKTLHSDHRDRETYALTEAGGRLVPVLEELAGLGGDYAAAQGIELLGRESEGPAPVESEESARWEAWSWLPL